MTVLARCIGVTVVHGHGDAAVQALAAVDFDVQRDETVALLGRSGSGKTTLLHVLGGLVSPTDGRVEWRGQPLASLDAAARGAIRAHGIAYVFQGANLLPHFTAYENVAFAAGLTDTESRPAGELLELVGLAGKEDSLPAELSGGEAQRVALARALAQQPQLLLCDEPTGHLDSDTAERTLDLIDALRDELGCSVVLATHDTSVAARLGRFVELHDGRVLAGQPA